MNLIAELKGKRLARRLARQNYNQNQDGTNGLKLTWIPALNFSEQEGAYILRLDMPGLRIEDIQFASTPFSLAIHARKRRGAVGLDGSLLDRRLIGSFDRHLPLPEGLDVSRVFAGYDKGVLTLVLPKLEKPELHSVGIE